MYLDLSIPATVFRVPSLPDLYQRLSTITITSTSSLPAFYKEYQTFILKIIQFIIDRVTLTTVIEEIQRLHTPFLRSEVTSVKQADTLLQQIESIFLSIIDNISSGVNIPFVLNRVKFLRHQLSTVTHLPAVYNDIAELIVHVLDKIINKEPLPTILTNLTAIKTAMAAEIHIAETIMNIQSIIILIVENIIKGTSVSALIPQIKNLQALIKKEFG